MTAVALRGIARLAPVAGVKPAATGLTLSLPSNIMSYSTLSREILNLRSLSYRSLSLLIALNYFAFRVELFKDEEVQNHIQPSTADSIAPSTLNWESFDKDNAPKAFTFDCEIQI